MLILPDVHCDDLTRTSADYFFVYHRVDSWQAIMFLLIQAWSMLEWWVLLNFNSDFPDRLISQRKHIAEKKYKNSSCSFDIEILGKKPNVKRFHDCWLILPAWYYQRGKPVYFLSEKLCLYKEYMFWFIQSNTGTCIAVCSVASTTSGLHQT